MSKPAAIVQIIVVALLLTYSTVHLFLGNFEKAFSPFPLLILYYIFVLARQKRRARSDDEEQS